MNEALPPAAGQPGRSNLLLLGVPTLRCRQQSPELTLCQSLPCARAYPVPELTLCQSLPCARAYPVPELTLCQSLPWKPESAWHSVAIRSDLLRGRRADRSGPEMRDHLLAHHLQRVRDPLVADPHAAVQLGKDA